MKSPVLADFSAFSARKTPVPASFQSRIRNSVRPAPIKGLQFDAIAARECAPVDPEILALFDAGVRSAEANAGDVVEIYGEIGIDFWTGTEITAKTVSAALKNMGDRNIEVRINSPGGDMFEGIAIYNVLADHKGDVTVKIMGLAASAASIIAMAGNEIKMGLGSHLMIHQCWLMVMGDQDDLAEMSDFLKPFDEGLRDVYASRTGQPAKKIQEWMKKKPGGKMFSASEAIDLGFADDMLTADAVTRDTKASQSARTSNKVREAEFILCKHGNKSRSEARAMIASIKGMPGAAPNAMQDAGEAGMMNAAQDFISHFRNA